MTKQPAMNQRWLILGLSTIAILAIASNTIEAGGQERDLALYDLAGPYSLDRSTRHVEDRPVIEAAIREFLWVRWQRHRLAHVAVVQYSLEGLATRTWYFIEPDQLGTW